MESSTTRAPASGGIGRWIARVLAVIAVAATVIALYVVISNSMDTSGGGSSDGPKQSKAQRTDGPKDTPDTYVVQAGDSLGSISVKVGIDVDKLETLNPDVDPQALQAGATLKLR